MFDLHLAGDSKQSKNMKCKDVSEGAASSDDVLPKKKKTTDSMDSGVLQPTGIQVRWVRWQSCCKEWAAQPLQGTGTMFIARPYHPLCDRHNGYAL